MTQTVDTSKDLSKAPVTARTLSVQAQAGIEKQRAEARQEADKILDEPVAIAPALRGVRTLRYVIILTDLLVTVLLPLAINYGWHHARFLIDCKAT